MKRRTLYLLAGLFLIAALPTWAMQGHDSHETAQEHNARTEGQSSTDGTSKHRTSANGLTAAFQVMLLTSMNLRSDKGETHHIMVTLMRADSGAPIKDAVGKMKVIGPGGKEQTGLLKSYSGMLAANFTFSEPGRYGVICLIKTADAKQVFKFWYPHR